MSNKLMNGKKAFYRLLCQFIGILAVAFLYSCGGQGGSLDTGTTNVFLTCGREGDSPYTTNHRDNSLPSKVCGSQTQAKQIHETVARKTASSVVFVRPFTLNAMGVRVFHSTGSGWFVAQDLVLTNRHVITLSDTEPARTGTRVEMILFTDSTQTAVTRVDGSVIAVASTVTDALITERGDLALIQLDNPVTSVTPLVLAPTQEPGKKVIAIGHPAVSTYFGQWHVTIGESVDCNTGNANRNAFDIAISAGMSGGPIIDEQRRVVGMSTASVSILHNCTFEGVNIFFDYPVLPVEVWAYPVTQNRFLSFSPNLEEIRSFLRKSFADPDLELNREYTEEAKTYTGLTEAQWPSTDRYFADWMNASLTQTEKTNLEKLATDSAEAIVLLHNVARSDGPSSCIGENLRRSREGVQGSGFLYQDDIVLTVAHNFCTLPGFGSGETDESCLAKWSGPAQKREVCIRTRRQEIVAATLIGIDLQADFAAVRLSRSLPDYPKLALQTTPYAADQALLGFGSGIDYVNLGLFHTVLGTSKTNPAPPGTMDYESDYELTFSAGMSGGPLIGVDGKVYTLAASGELYSTPANFYKPSKLIIKNVLPFKIHHDRELGPSVERMRMKLLQWKIETDS